MVVTVRSPNLAETVAQYNGTPVERFQTHILQSNASFMAHEFPPSSVELQDMTLSLLSDDALSSGATTAVVDSDDDTVSLVVDLATVPVRRNGGDARSSFKGSEFVLAYIPEYQQIRPDTDDASVEYDPSYPVEEFIQTNLTTDQVETIAVQEPRFGPLATALDEEGDPTFLYAPSQDEPVRTETNLPPGTVVTFTVQKPLSTVKTRVRVRPDNPVKDPRGIDEPAVDGWRHYFEFDFRTHSTTPTEYNFVAEHDGEVVSRFSSRVAATDASLDVPRQRGDGRTVIVRDVLLSHGGLLVLEDESGEVLTVNRTPSRSLDRIVLHVPEGVDVPTQPRVVAYRDIDINGSLDPIDVPYRANGSVVADSGEYVTPTSTPTPTQEPTTTSTPTPTGTPTRTSTPTTDGSVPGFGVVGALAGLVALLVLAARRE
jgi:PGF-CTERM protein